MNNSSVLGQKRKHLQCSSESQNNSNFNPLVLLKQQLALIDKKIEALSKEKEQILSVEAEKRQMAAASASFEYPRTFPAGKNPRARPGEPNHAEAVQNWNAMCREMAKRNEIYPEMRFCRGIERGRHLTGEHYASFCCKNGQKCNGGYRYRCHIEDGKKVYYLRWSKPHTCT